MATESTPLLQSINEDIENLKEAYGTDCHAKFVMTDCKSENLVDYTPMKFSSFRVFCITRGTILQDPVLFMEQLFITLIFALSAAPVYIMYRADVINRTSKDDVNMKNFLDKQEEKMRVFAMIMTNLAAFLLSFYTAICVARWWAIRTGGIGGIKAATVDLEMLIYQNVTKETKVLSAIRRYGRVSLMLIFLWRRNQTANLKDYFVSKELLLEHEADQLLKWNHCLHETIWAWQAGIVTMLHKEGKIQSDQMHALLLQRCTEGRAAVQLIHTHLAVRVPMQYVHLLGLLVKMHNGILALIMGLLFGAALKEREIIICVQLFARTLILPLLFNAVLLINVQLADPFNGSSSDFPGLVYQAGLEKDCEGLIGATDNFPEWLAKRTLPLKA